MLSVDSVILRGEHKQWIWDFPEVELGDGSKMNLRKTRAPNGRKGGPVEASQQNECCPRSRTKTTFHFRISAVAECKYMSAGRWAICDGLHWPVVRLRRMYCPSATLNTNPETRLEQLTKYIFFVFRPLFSTSSIHILITFGTFP